MNTCLASRFGAALRPVAAAAILLAVGCAAPQKKVLAEWPPPPEKARIQYLGMFRNGADLAPGAGRRILNTMLPHESGSEITSPSGLALSPDERRLYVAAGGRGRVIVVDREARTMKVFPGKGMKISIDVALDADENVYVSDRAGNAVFVFDRSGTLLRRIASDALEGPTALAIDRRAQVLYVLSGRGTRGADHHLDAFTLAGKHLRTIGKRGETPGEFNFPSALFVAPDGTLFVSDMLNFRVQKFDRDGQLVGLFGKLGTGMPGAFDKIKGIAFDTFRNVYVVDSMQGVHILNAEARPLMLFGAPPVMGTPGPIVIDSKNHIFVADFALNAVHEFRLVNTTATDSYAAPPDGPASPPAGEPAPSQAPAPGTPAGQ